MTTFTYFCIAFFGVALVAISFFFGGDADGDAAGAITGADGVDVAGDPSGHVAGELGSWFSLKVVAAFATGFGAAGMAASVLGAGPVWSAVAAMGFGAAMGVMARQIVQLFLKNEASSHDTESKLGGATGMVSQTILEGRLGEVEVKGVYRAARSADGKEIRSGVPVRVVTTGSILVVEPMDKPAQAEGQAPTG